jgi:hypothetical protein
MVWVDTLVGGEQSLPSLIDQILTPFRWVYIIEGIFSIAIGLAVWFGLPTNPAEAYFLNEEEKEMMRIRYAQTKQYLGSEEFSWEEIWIEFRDPKLYISGCIQFCQVCRLACP